MLDTQNSILIGTFSESNNFVSSPLPDEDVLFSRFDDLVQVPEAEELFGILDQAIEFTTQLTVSGGDSTSAELGIGASSNAGLLHASESGVYFDSVPSQHLVGVEVANVKPQVVLASALTDASQAPGSSVVAADTNGQSFGREIVQQTVASFPKFTPEVSDQRQLIELTINPPELGQMSIQVEFSAGQIAAQIAVSDLMTAELLASEKEYLLDSLVDAGFDGVDVDISHQFLMDQDDGQSESTGPDTAEQMSGDTNKVASASLHKAGLNLLA